MSLFLFAAILQIFIFLVLCIMYYLSKRKYIIFIAIGFSILFISSISSPLPFRDKLWLMLVNYLLTITGFMLFTHGSLLLINSKLSKKIVIPMLLLTVVGVMFFNNDYNSRTFYTSCQFIVLASIVLYKYIIYSKNERFKGLNILITANLINLLLYVSNLFYIAFSWLGISIYTGDSVSIFYITVTIYYLLSVAGVFLVTQEMIEKQNQANKEMLVEKEDYYNQLRETNSLLDRSKAFLYKLENIESDKIIVSKELALYMGMDEQELGYKNDNEYYINRSLFWDKYINEDYKYLKITKSKIINGEIDLDKLYHIKAYRYVNEKPNKRWFELSYIANGYGGFDVAILDITRLKNTIRTDYLTGVRNNIAFSEDFDNKCFEGHIVAFADIDKFKEVNDNFGHIVGDEVISKTANMLQFDGMFTVYRISGDEFIFVSKEKCKLNDVYENISKCEFDMTVGGNNAPLKVSLSVGVIEYAADHNYSKDELFNILDNAMYNAKKHKSKYSEITEHSRDYKNLFYSSVQAQVIINIESIKMIEGSDTIDVETIMIMDVSDAYVKLFKGKSKLDFIERFPIEVFPKYQPNGQSSVEFISDEIKNVLENRRGNVEITQLDLEGNELIVNQESAITKNNGIDILVMIKKDITKYRKAENKIIQLSERLNGVIESAKVLVWTIDYTKTPYELWASSNVKDFFDIEQDENGYAEYEDWNRVLFEGIGKEKFENYKRKVFKENVSELDLIKFKNGYGEYNYLTFRSKETKFDDRGKMTALTGVVINSNSEMEKIRQIEENKNKINQLNDRLKSLIKTSNVMICTFDFSKKTPQIWASDNAENYINVRQDENGFIPYEDWLTCADKALGSSFNRESNLSMLETYLSGFEFVKFENAYGQINYLNMKSVNTEFDNHGNLIESSCIFMNIHDQKLREEKLLKESRVDKLTGLYNSRYLNKYLENLKYKKDVKIVVGYLTILGLRHINNAYGYVSGERLIVYVAKILNKFKSDNTSVFRVSNDEFVIVTKNEYSYKTIIKNDSLVELEKALKGRVKINDNDLSYRLCCGVLAYPYYTDDFDNLIYLSEMTMMHGKDNRQNIQYYDSKVIENIFHERKVIKDFNEADLEKEFVLYYQPVINTQQNRYSSFEALVR